MSEEIYNKKKENFSHILIRLKTKEEVTYVMFRMVKSECFFLLLNYQMCMLFEWLWDLEVFSLIGHNL